jgi:hypothetical protein
MLAMEESTQGPATPILDSGILPARSENAFADSMIGVLWGLCGGVIVARVGAQANRNSSVGYALLGFVAMSILAISVHELGHIAAGWLVGFRFRFISIGPLSLGLEHGMVRVRIRLERGALGYAGIRVDRVLRLRRRLLIFIAAGPAANLLSIPSTVFVVNYAFPRLGDTWLATLAVEFVVVSLLLAIIGLVPFGSSPRTDGARIATLLGSKDGARRWMSSCAVTVQLNNGTRPREWKSTWLRAATSLHDGSADEFLANFLAYTSANDRKVAPEAALHLERCLELASTQWPSTRDLLAQEAAVFTAWFRRDAAVAEKWASQIGKPKLMSRLLQIRLSVALDTAKSDFQRAREELQVGLAFVERLPVSAAQGRLREGWIEWQEEIEERQKLLSV